MTCRYRKCLNEALPGRAQCATCSAVKAARSRKDYLLRKDLGICARCPCEAHPGRILCRRCALKEAAKASRRYHAKKLARVLANHRPGIKRRVA